MEKQIIAAIKQGLSGVAVYEDFAVEEAKPPYVVIQRVGGAGNLYLEQDTGGGYQVRLQVAVWALSRRDALAHAAAVEKALVALPNVAALGAGVSVFDPDAGLRGVHQDFSIVM